MTRSKILSVVLVLPWLAAVSMALASDGHAGRERRIPRGGRLLRVLRAPAVGWPTRGYVRRGVLLGHAGLREGDPHCGALHGVQLHRRHRYRGLLRPGLGDVRRRRNRERFPLLPARPGRPAFGIPDRRARLRRCGEDDIPSRCSARPRSLGATMVCPPRTGSRTRTMCARGSRTMAPQRPRTPTCRTRPTWAC